jgi:alpha-1,3-rhamnosyl/mannosyltransferase
MLVLVGRKAWGSNSIDNEIEQLNIKDRILKTGYVSNFDLRCLYSKARAFLFPSIYEGFGIPILEAFACGCPVVTSRVSSMPEVAGNAALLIDPTKGDELVTAISQILDSEILRHDLIKKGLERLKNFSWNNCAQILLDAF